MSDFDFNKINPQYSIIFLPMNGSFRQDVGPNLLVDGDMEAAGTSAYTSVNSAILTKELDSYEGSQCLRVAYGGVGNPFAQQLIASNGDTCRILGHIRGDGTRNPKIYFGSPSIFSGTTSTSWQSVDVIAIQDALERIAILSSGTIGYCEFDAFEVINHPMTIQSLAINANQTYAILGDGHSSATFPEQLQNRGLSFGGSDYIDLDWSAGGALDTQTFTFICHAKAKPSDLNAASTYLYEIGTPTLRYILYWDKPTETINFLLYDGLTNLTLTSTNGYADGSDHIYAVSIDSIGCKIYQDGEIISSIVGDVRFSAFTVGAQALIGKFAGASTSNFKGIMYQAAIYDFALSEAQVREWTRRAKALRNI